MPALTNHQSKQTLKMLFVAPSGAGKTGALASLAAAGFNLRILDLDNGLDVLVDLLQNPNSKYKGGAERVHFRTITEEMKNVNGKLIPKTAKMWPTAIKMLDHWRDEGMDSKDEAVKAQAIANGGVDLGPISSWGSDDILVIDSLTMLSTAALNYVLSLNMRLGQRPHQSDWGEGQGLIEGLLQTLYAGEIKCNVIILCHVKHIGEENGPQVGYPNTLGQALPPKVGSYFNTILYAKTTGQGNALKREILTKTSGVVELKNTAPLKVADRYPLETGLADYFRAVLGTLPGDKK